MGEGLKRARAAARATQQDDTTTKLYDAVLEHLRPEWLVLSIGGIEVRHNPEDRKLNHEFVVRFTGTNEAL